LHFHQISHLQPYLLRNNPISHELLAESSEVTNPVEYSFMPQQAVIPVRNPMALIREVQEATLHAQALQHVERLQRL
jgi:hypothetical protein